MPNPRFLAMAKRMASSEPPKPREEKPSGLEQLIDFCGVQLQKQNYKVLQDLYGSVGKRPEDFYSQNNQGNIKINNNLVTFLNVDGMKLTYLPESIGNLQSLEILYLGGNKLTYVPESIGNLQSLRKLYLWGNQLTYVPESIGNLQSLRKLDLRSNQLNKDSYKIIDELKAKGVSVDV